MRSITYGEVDMKEIVRIIHKHISIKPHLEHSIIIGTDSQNFDTTKIVLVIALYTQGNGGIFFYEVTKVKKITNIRQKLQKETQISLDCAEKLLKEFERYYEEVGFDYTQINFTIHVDAGYNGPTKAVIPEIVGWITSCGFNCKIKPESYVASSIADRISK